MIQVQDVITPVASYDLVAPEYYEPERHPTCANFRDASQILLRTWLARIPSQSQICDVGAGKSLLAEILFEERRSLETLVLVDQSKAMLAYSEPWSKVGAALLIASASALPCAAECFDLITACLGDPYNIGSFWTEIHRVLKVDGKCLFTTPSHDWAHAFRSGLNPDSKHNSEFELVDGSVIALPSHIYSEFDQVRLIESAGLVVSEISRIPIRSLFEKKLSPKLLVRRGPDASVVTGYVATKVRGVRCASV